MDDLAPTGLNFDQWNNWFSNIDRLAPGDQTSFSGVGGNGLEGSDGQEQSGSGQRADDARGGKDSGSGQGQSGALNGHDATGVDQGGQGIKREEGLYDPALGIMPDEWAQ